VGIGEEGGRWRVERSADAAGVDAGERERQGGRWKKKNGVGATCQ